MTMHEIRATNRPKTSMLTTGAWPRTNYWMNHKQILYERNSNRFWRRSMATTGTFRPKTTTTTATITQIEKPKSMKRVNCSNGVWPKRAKHIPLNRHKNVRHSNCTLMKCTSDIFSTIITAPIPTDRTKCVAFIRHCRWSNILVIQIVPLCKIAPVNDSEKK